MASFIQRSNATLKTTIPASAVDAGEHFTWLAHFLAADSPASSALTRELLDWQPVHRCLIDDLDEGHYLDN